MLVSGRTVSAVDIDTPKGIQLNLEVCGKFADDKKSAICTVIKDSGDDPDVTNGMPVCAKVFLTDDGSIKVDGGEGVGRVTKSGLYQKVGAAAINRVPMQMILAELQKIKEDFDMKEGFYAEIILPMGKELAHKTFNPRLGIEGGLSVLGTSGIVERSEERRVGKECGS